MPGVNSRHFICYSSRQWRESCSTITKRATQGFRLLIFKRITFCIHKRAPACWININTLPKVRTRLIVLNLLKMGSKRFP